MLRLRLSAGSAYTDRMTSPGADDAAPGSNLRADAARNREKILDAAARLFAERGVEASLNDVAREAGVGVGTVYRKFPDKDALIEELTASKLRGMLELVAAASTRSSGAEALRELMMGAAELRAVDRGLFPTLFRVGDRARRDDRVRELLQAWDAVIARARAEGAVRAGFAAADVDLFMMMVGTVADRTRHLGPAAWRRCAHVLLDGYAAHPGDDPVPPLPLDEQTRRGLFLGQ
ncbi:MAG: TetR family transcriptional regulator [Microbacterium sp.]|nr:MAG: TetR family transcriptional regulator [Microbacterium sp.]